MIRSTELRKSLERPAIEIEGKVYLGRLLSWPESLVWLPKPREWVLVETPDATVEAEVRELLTLLAFKTEDGEAMNLETFMQLERPIATSALADFFRCLRQSAVAPTDGVESPTTT